MEPIQTITVIIFALTIVLVVVRWVDSVVGCLVGSSPWSWQAA